MSLAFTYTIYIGQPPAQVWEALISKPLVDQYFLAPLLKFDLFGGGEVSYGYDTPVIVGAIKEVAVGEKLSHTFAFSDNPDYATLVSYELERRGPSITALTLTHSGFAEDDQTYADISGGWPAILSSLKTLLETGETLLWPR